MQRRDPKPTLNRQRTKNLQMRWKNTQNAPDNGSKNGRNASTE
jgi:hypothetical protein